MSWNPNPSNAIIFRAGTMALIFEEDPDFPGKQLMVVLARASVAVEWQTVQNGTIFSRDWSADVALAGGWASWIKREVDQINACIHARLGDSSPIVPVSTLPAGTPATWDECVAWLLANLWVKDTTTTSNLMLGEKPVAPPVHTPTPVGIFPLWINRAFAGGYAFDFGINADGSPACRVQYNGWKDAAFS